MIQKKGKKRAAEAESTTAEKAVLASTPESVKFAKKKKTGPAAQNGQQKPAAKVAASTEQAPAAKTAKDQKKKQQKIEKKQEDREQKKLERTEKGEEGASNKLDTPELIKEKIAEIKSRDSLSRTAKRKLAVLTKKLKVLEGTTSEEESKKPVAKPAAEAVKGKNKQEAVKAKKGAVEETEVKAGKQDAKAKDNKKKGKQPPKVQEIKKPVVEEVEEEEEDDEDDDVEEDEKELTMEVEDEEDEDDDVDDEDDDEEEASDEEDEQDDAEEEDDDDDDDDEDAEEEDDKPAAKSKKPEVTEEQRKKPANEDDKKKRYVLFVGKLPDDIDEDTLRKHFMTKCSEISSIRIPKQPNSNKSRGFAYVEFSSNVDYEKGFSLHNSLLNGRRLNVQYSRQDKSNMSRQQAVAKNMKLHALSKAGKFGGRQNKFQRKPFQKRDNKPFHKPGQT